ncbi:hypothetical protein ACOME3_004384 [Neoechinorhynchus agilis]
MTNTQHDRRRESSMVEKRTGPISYEVKTEGSLERKHADNMRPAAATSEAVGSSGIEHTNNQSTSETEGRPSTTNPLSRARG